MIEPVSRSDMIFLKMRPADQETDALTSFHLDITFDDRKFSFQATDAVFSWHMSHAYVMSILNLVNLAGWVLEVSTPC